MSVNVYKSTDTNAPVLYGGFGSLTTLLQACLVDGYGPAASVSVSYSANPADGDTITIDGVTYRWKTTPVAVNDVFLHASNAASSIQNLLRTIDGTGTAGSHYYAGSTTPHSTVWSASSGNTSPITLTARVSGTGGNSIAISKSSSVLTLGGSTFSGGSANTSSSAGWTRSYSGSNNAEAAFRQGSGLQHYCYVNDLRTGTDTSKEAEFAGFESMSAINSGSGKFPTDAQATGSSEASGKKGLIIRKSVAGDGTQRVWILVADDRTFYLFIISGDTFASGVSPAVYTAYVFGDTYSILSGTDLYRTTIGGNLSTDATDSGRTFYATTNISATAYPDNFIARSYTAVGGSKGIVKIGDSARQNVTGNYWMGTKASGLPTPNPVDGSLHISPIHIGEGGTTNTCVRGRYRGGYHLCHKHDAFSDGDTIVGAGPYAGRTFLVIKPTGAGNVNNGMACIDITGPWETN